MLNMPTLVLNKTWTPINVTTVRRAIVLAFVDLAHIVDVHSYELFSFDGWVRRGPTNGNIIRGVNVAFDVPEVVVVKHYDKVPRGGVVFSRRNLYRRDRFMCQYCLSRPGTEELTIDHVTPRSRGGHTAWENCVLACMSCNTRKGNKLPEEAGMKLKTTPKRPAWSPLYGFARRNKRPTSWDAFISDAYWNTELED
jgi:5-methylcytosine-specific restriction endonuclease McrA